jgi:hypothetical protein
MTRTRPKNPDTKNQEAGSNDRDGRDSSSEHVSWQRWLVLLVFPRPIRAGASAFWLLLCSAYGVVPDLFDALHTLIFVFVLVPMCLLAIRAPLEWLVAQLERQSLSSS